MHVNGMSFLLWNTLLFENLFSIFSFSLLSYTSFFCLSPPTIHKYSMTPFMQVPNAQADTLSCIQNVYTTLLVLTVFPVLFLLGYHMYLLYDMASTNVYLSEEVVLQGLLTLFIWHLAHGVTVIFVQQLFEFFCFLVQI